MKELVKVFHDCKNNYFTKLGGERMMTKSSLGKYISKMIFQGKKTEGILVYMSKQEFDEYEKRIRVKEVEQDLQ